MSDDTQQPIIVKKIKKGGGGAHGGAWKIAYADFVTAMMAFFLLMWLLGSTAQGDLQGIAEFFENPLKVAQQGGSGSGDSSSVIQGGGRDLTRQTGQVKYGAVETKQRSISISASSQESDEAAKVKQEQAAKERARLVELKSQIEARIEANPDLRPFRNQLMLDVTAEGLRIQIVDVQNRPMFTSASDRLQPYTQKILREIGVILNQVDNRVFLSGHTDATPFSGGLGGFSNWELSANRANASRRELIYGGMDPDKVLRVVGMASIVPFDKEDPYNPINRRISIVVLNRDTEQAMLSDGRSVNVEDVAAAAAGGRVVP